MQGESHALETRLIALGLFYPFCYSLNLIFPLLARRQPPQAKLRRKWQFHLPRA